MIGPKVVFSVFRAGLRSLPPIAKYPLCDAVDVRTVQDQQFDPDDVTGQSADGDAAAEAAAAGVGIQLAEPGRAEAYWAATGTAESRGAGQGRTRPAAAGAAAVVGEASIRPAGRRGGGGARAAADGDGA